MGSRAEELLNSPIGLQLLESISEADPASLTYGQLAELIELARRQVSVYRSDYQSHVDSLKSKSRHLEPLAGWLVQRYPQWWSDLDRSQEVWVSTEPGVPKPSRLVPDLSAYGPEISKPRRGFWTSTETPTSWSPWLDWLRFGEDSRPGPYYLWRLKVEQTARVKEIHTAADWSSLNRDWSAVAGAWDGVHLSVGGFLTAQPRGWDMESTVWFRWSFSFVELLMKLDR